MILLASVCQQPRLIDAQSIVLPIKLESHTVKLESHTVVFQPRKYSGAERIVQRRDPHPTEGVISGCGDLEKGQIGTFAYLKYGKVKNRLPPDRRTIRQPGVGSARSALVVSPLQIEAKRPICRGG